VDKFFRFSDYDLFGYLASGIISLGLCDIVVGTKFVLRDSWSISSAVAVILASYIVGHIISGLAALLIDRGLVRPLFGTPANLLMRSEKRNYSWLQRALLGEFLKPLHPSLRSRVLRRVPVLTRLKENCGMRARKCFGVLGQLSSASPFHTEERILF
jgi:hypothetical protein